MRLYALQHIGLQRDGGNLTDSLAEEVMQDLEALAAAPDGEVAGTAIALLAEWGGSDRPVDFDVLDRAVEIAAADTRPVDVRVTALHAAQARALPLARELSEDSSQPVLVRKAAIACIGRHGVEADCSNLEKLGGQNSRLAQAADPAVQAIRKRLSDPDAPAPIPF
jgi:hypothetical protein